MQTPVTGRALYCKNTKDFFMHVVLTSHNKVKVRVQLKQLRWSRGSMLAFGTHVRGFKPDQSRWIFQGEIILSAPSFRGEVKPSVPCHRFTACKRSPNVTWKSGIFRQNSSAISLAHVVPPLAARISRRWLVAKVHKHLHLWLLGPHSRRLAVRAGTSKGSTISQYGCSAFGALATEAQ